MGQSKERWSRLPFQLGLVALVVAAVFSTSLSVPFLEWDDTYYVTQSVRTQTPGWAGLVNVWSSADIWDGRFMEFFPLRDTVYWAVWQLFGKNALPFHLVSIALHAGVASLVLLFARKIGSSIEVAFFAGLLFAVHPIHVESVSWVAGLKDPLFACFVLGGLVAFLHYRQTLRPRFFALTLGCLVAGLLSKSIALAMPLVMVAIDRLVGTPTPWRTMVARVTGPLIIACLFAVQFVMVGKVANVITPPHAGSWGAHFMLTAWAFARYLQMSVAPASFLLHYCFAPIEGPGDARLWLSFLAIAGVVVGLVITLRRAPLAALLILWFLAFLIPVSNIVPFPAVMADRYLYLPSVASCLGLSWACSKLGASRGRLVCGALVATYALVTLLRGMVWGSEAELWREVIEQGTCSVDDAPTSAVVFLKDAAFQTEPQLKLERYQSAIAHPAFTGLNAETRCGALGAVAQLSLTVDPPLALRSAQEMAELCPWLASSWDSLCAVTLQFSPADAVDPARRAFRLGRTAQRKWHLGLAMVLSGDANGAGEIAGATAAAPAKLCGPTLQLSTKLSPEIGLRLAAIPQCALILQK